MWFPHRTTSKLPPSSCGLLWIALCVGVFPNKMQKWLWRAVLAPSRAFRASRQTPQCRAEVRKFLKESPSIQTITRCIGTKVILSIPGYRCLSGPRWHSVSVHTKTVFSCSISKCLQKQNVKASLFVLSACASYLVLCNIEGASISEDSPHPYQRLAFIWGHWKCMHFLLGRKGGKAKMGKQMWQINWVEMELPLRGESKQCAYWVAELL